MPVLFLCSKPTLADGPSQRACEVMMEISEGAAEVLREEYELLRKLNHPNIVHAHEYFVRACVSTPRLQLRKPRHTYSAKCHGTLSIALILSVRFGEHV